MLFMRFPWCDYDKEALHAFDVKKKGETSTPHYLNVITRIRLINKSDYLNCTVFAIAKAIIFRDLKTNTFINHLIQILD